MHPGLTTITAVKTLVGEMVTIPALAKCWATLSSKAQWELILEWQEILAFTYEDWCDCGPEMTVIPGGKEPTPLHPLEPAQKQHDEDGA